MTFPGEESAGDQAAPAGEGTAAPAPSPVDTAGAQQQDTQVETPKNSPPIPGDDYNLDLEDGRFTLGDLKKYPRRYRNLTAKLSQQGQELSQLRAQKAQSEMILEALKQNPQLAAELRKTVDGLPDMDLPAERTGSADMDENRLRAVAEKMLEEQGFDMETRTELIAQKVIENWEGRIRVKLSNENYGQIGQIARERMSDAIEQGRPINIQMFVKEALTDWLSRDYAKRRAMAVKPVAAPAPQTHGRGGGNPKRDEQAKPDEWKTKQGRASIASRLAKKFGIS